MYIVYLPYFWFTWLFPYEKGSFDMSKRHSPASIDPLSDLVASFETASLSTDSEEWTAWGLDGKVKGQLLIDIEAAGGLFRVKAALLCDTKKHLYGARNSALRRKVQNLITRWKRQSHAAFENEKRSILGNFREAPSTPTLPTRVNIAGAARSPINQPFPFHRSPVSQQPSIFTMSRQPWENFEFGPGKSIVLSRTHICQPRKTDLFCRRKHHLCGPEQARISPRNPHCSVPGLCG